MKETLERICAILDNGKELIGDSKLIVGFQENVKNMLDHMDEILEKERTLRIGIVGEVKAGKSSFLNALLFEGQDVLPKAPTPMTAALTKLSYSKTPTTTVYFYSMEEWKGIEKRAREYDATLDRLYNEYKERINQEEKERQRQKSLREKANDVLSGMSGSSDARKGSAKTMEKSDFERIHRDKIPGEMRSCNEVVQMMKEAEKNGINIYNFLGKTQEIAQSGNSIEKYMADLEEYVGSTGHYTPIVKYTEIQLDNPVLEGIEVIDTPGLNDPVQSRSRATEKFLMQCDVVFLLSYCGQFLGAEDIEFITHTLPYDGINKAVLIGSKLDSAVLQYPGRNSTFAKAYRGTERNCNDQAQENIGKCMHMVRNSALLDQLQKALPPILTSAMAYSAGMKRQKGCSLNKDEEHMIAQMKKRFPDYQDSVNYLMCLSGIEEAREKGLSETKVQKTKIIEEKISTFQGQKKAGFLRDLEEISIGIRTTRDDLENFDGTRLEKQMKDIRKRLESARYDVTSIFTKAALETKAFTNDLMMDARDEMNNFLQINVRAEKKTEHHSSTSGHLWWKKKERWDEIIIDNVAEVHDVDNNLRNFNNGCWKIINKSFKELIPLKEISNQVKDAVMKAFDQTDPDFNENKILVPLENALKRLTIVDLPTMDLEKYIERLDSKLEGIAIKGVVKNEDIPQLKRIQSQILSEMAEDIVERICEEGKKVEDSLNTEAGIFIDSIEKTLNVQQEKLKELVVKKDENLKRLSDFLDRVTEAKEKLQEV